MRSPGLWTIPAILLLTILLGTGAVSAGEESATPTASTDNPLDAFARAVMEANREVAASRQDLEASRQEYRKVPTRFQPILTITEDNAKSANRNYNSLTGIDEDYTTRQQGTQVSLKQETRLGTGRIDLARTRTAYTQAQNSYFQSAYLALDRSVFRNPGQKIALEKRVGRQQFRSAATRTEASIQQVLLEGFRALFERIIAKQEFEFKSRSLAFYQNLVEEADLKLANGLGSELDLKQARMRQSNAETGLEQSRLSLEEADRRLGLVLGSADWERSLASFTPGAIASLVPDRLDVQEVLHEGLPQRFELRQAETQVDLQRQALRLARDGARPDVNLSLRWGRQGRGTSEELARDMRDKSWEVIFTWTQPIGERAEVLDRRAEAIKLAATTLRRDQAAEEGRKAIQEAVARVGFHRQRVRDLSASSRLSAEVLEGQRLNFQLGKTSLLDLSRYQEEHQEACLAVIRAEAELVLSWLNLLAETGGLARQFGPADLD